MLPEKLDIAKKQLLEYVVYSFNRNPKSDSTHLVNTFLFDSITFLRDVQLSSEEEEFFIHFIDNNANLEKFVTNSLHLFVELFKISRAKKNMRYKVSVSEEPTVANIFLGLEYSGNNDTNYKNLPSALSLATFKV